MPLRVVGVLVHTEDDRDVLAGRRDGDDHLLRAAVDVRPEAGRAGEDAGGLDDHVHAHLASRQGGPTRLSDLTRSERISRPGIPRLVTDSRGTGWWSGVPSE
ncbi:hypothetical protein [Streptomyces mirabilis]|uniref:Uncharacterized protein n=1 Tax=Streptomyces mirabilis TaxID=68239 RepID=A0A1I2AVR8_9ACTN|nr:hypothetical protein [Streptomyces mirabilis]SFE46990.1 hypothetical protein SAMN02787118_101814 [Streptomyces mirabilis]